MAHVTFYRKYRSKTFAEIIGQEHIIQTLKNAINYDRLTHAYIFSGPRGTGKTSTARILAKSLNCRAGLSDKPCLTCDLCQKISAGTAVDVIEIDAASNTGVDNIRQLNEQVNFAPVECLYKIYIIDEVHMLSTGAFNALLKTLEEPPQKTIFILATTEPHKIPTTIHSRCQQLNFRKLTSKEIISQLQLIAANEELQIPEKALAIIARNSSGCMRDAISLLDQIYSFKGKTIATEDILLILGTTDFESLVKLISYFLDNEPENTIKLLDSFFNNGANISQLTTDIVDLVKNLLYIKMNIANLLDLDEARLSVLAAIAAKVSLPKLQEALEMLAKLESELRWIPNPQLLLQVRLLTFMHNQIAISSGATSESVVLPSPASAPVVKSSEFRKKPILTDNNISKTLNNEPDHSAKPVNWRLFLNELKKEKPSLFMILNGSQLINTSEETIKVKLNQSFSFFKEKIKESDTQLFLTSLLKKIYGKPYKLLLEENSANPRVNSLATPAAIKQGNNSDAVVKSSTSSSAVTINKIIDIFEGTVV